MLGANTAVISRAWALGDLAVAPATVPTTVDE